MAIFARAASRGRCKRRLIPLLGARGAAEFQAALISDTLRKFSKLHERAALYFFLAGRPLPPAPSLANFTVAPQRGRALGGRVARAFRRLLGRHPAAVIVGADIPTMPLRALTQALGELRICDAVLGPSPDGGYYLVGLRRERIPCLEDLFLSVRWGSEFAFGDTLKNLLGCGLSCAILEPQADVDREEDFRRLARELAASRVARNLAPATWRFMRPFV